MKKYIIFLMPDEDDENYDQHELIGVEYGEDIYDATDRLIGAVCDDLSGNPENARCEVFAYPPEELEESGRYQYQLLGIVSPPYAEENTVLFYGVQEIETD
ncbi:MAG: carboxylate--amine ligase [Oscillospiraceae bacterium]|nr:carboxylate--amine ligase [Oscillospiraceae bacterium]